MSNKADDFSKSIHVNGDNEVYQGDINDYEFEDGDVIAEYELKAVKRVVVKAAFEEIRSE